MGDDARPRSRRLCRLLDDDRVDVRVRRGPRAESPPEGCAPGRDRRAAKRRRQQRDVPRPPRIAPPRAAEQTRPHGHADEPHHLLRGRQLRRRGGRTGPASASPARPRAAGPTTTAIAARSSSPPWAGPSTWRPTTSRPSAATGGPWSARMCPSRSRPARTSPAATQSSRAHCPSAELGRRPPRQAGVALDSAHGLRDPRDPRGAGA